ncbi:M23 family metallopeptidase [uncultured Odoribacter sp.]|uniref:M23 family metallopeptidase n=1 Tax=uncultured Odoribacter sp. TaxID=876416 RepID=UPI00260AE4C4|nr:M23 family metallopeptidase [uncultured Odoribacter sp.]
MNFRKSFLFILLSVSLFFTSCSFRHIPEAPFSTQLHAFSTEGMLIPSPLAYSDYLPKPAEFIAPAPQITDIFNGEERYLVRAKTENLFDKCKELWIDFGQIAENSFVFPLPNARILSQYGRRHNRPHTGIDIKTFANDTIRAAFDGIVRIAGRTRGYGNVVVIRHYNGLETVYGHNSKFLVKAGDKVNAGDPISLEGRTGRATTEHLHFETRINGQPFDPSLIIDFVEQKLHNKCLVFTPDEKGKIHIDKYHKMYE